jgi:hypothetical protein
MSKEHLSYEKIAGVSERAKYYAERLIELRDEPKNIREAEHCELELYAAIELLNMINQARR